MLLWRLTKSKIFSSQNKDAGKLIVQIQSTTDRLKSQEESLFQFKFKDRGKKKHILALKQAKGVFFYSNVLAKSLSHVCLFASLWTVTPQALLSLDSPGKNTGMGCHTFLQGIFLTHGLNPYFLHLQHWQVLQYQCYLGSPYLDEGQHFVPCRLLAIWERSIHMRKSHWLQSVI